MKKKIITIVILILIIIGIFFLLKNERQKAGGETEEVVLVEKYVRDNIKTIATNKPVLGGSWYVVSIFVNQLLNEGIVVYEDGHIESNAKFTYEFDNKTKEIKIKEFETSD